MPLELAAWAFAIDSGESEIQVGPLDESVLSSPSLPSIASSLRMPFEIKVMRAWLPTLGINIAIASVDVTAGKSIK